VKPLRACVCGLWGIGQNQQEIALKRILIFTAGYGEGHNTAARNIRDGLEFVAEDECHVEVLDLFETCYGRLNDFIKKTYLTAINSTPRLWQGFYNLIDHASGMDNNLFFLSKMKQALADLLREADPDVVVTTYPVYNYLLQELYPDGKKPFSHVTVVTDSISVNSIWHRAHSDFFLVANEMTAEVMRQAGVPAEKLRVLGFPVQLVFANPEDAPALPDPSIEKKVLYIINSGRKKAPRIVERLLELEDLKLTVTVGRSEELRKEIEQVIRGAESRVTIFGWTTRIPHFLLSHHIVISKAGGATTQEAIAARCPMIANQVVPGQEEGNYETLRMADAGLLAEKPREIRDAVKQALCENGAARWRQLRENISKISMPDSSIKIAKFLLDEAVTQNAPTRKLASLPNNRLARDIASEKKNSC